MLWNIQINQCIKGIVIIIQIANIIWILLGWFIVCRGIFIFFGEVNMIQDMLWNILIFINVFGLHFLLFNGCFFNHVVDICIFISIIVVSKT